MRVAGWLSSPSIRKGLLVAGVLGGCFTWAMVVFGLSFAMVERSNRQWWLVPVFGLLVLVIAVLATRGALALQRRAEERPGVSAEAPREAPLAVTRVLAEPLSPREVEVLRQLAAGRSNREIAAALFVAPGTVKAHLNHIFRKLEAGSRIQAVVHAREAGLLGPQPEINPD